MDIDIDKMEQERERLRIAFRDEISVLELARQRAEHPLWIDILPSEVGQRIAKCVTSRFYTKDSAISLACASEEQASFVKGALKNEFEMRRFSASAEMAAFLMQDDIRRVSTHKIDLDNDYAYNCLRSMTLQSAEADGSAEALQALSHAKNLSALKTTYTSNTLDEIVNNISALQLKELRINCDRDQGGCFKEALLAHEDRGFLARAFPSVSVLELMCFCDDVSPSFWDIVEPFPNLEDLTIEATFPVAAIDRLKRLRSVRLTGEDSFLRAGEIGASVTGVICHHNTHHGVRFYPKHEIEGLRNCPRLRELVCCLEEGAETVLPALSGNLKILEIASTKDVIEDADGSVIDMFLAEPERCVMLQTVKAAPFLEALHLSSMRIHREEMVEIVRSIGRRLKSLTISIPDQRQDVARYLTELFIVIANDNPNLESAYFELHPLFFEDYFRDMPWQLAALEKLEAAYNVMLRRTLKLQVGFFPIESLQEEIARARNT